MKKSILSIQGIRVLNKNEQKIVAGGHHDPCQIQQACCGKPGYPPCMEK
ncbi:hypothetical protein [Flavobacterium sp. J27]|nr:hypothetical protein [Flavobacterium sp. J27]